MAKQRKPTPAEVIVKISELEDIEDQGLVTAYLLDHMKDHSNSGIVKLYAGLLMNAILANYRQRELTT